MESFKCVDIGMKCGYETTAPTKEELLLKIGMHANATHQMSSVDPPTLKAINSAIKQT